MGKVSNSRNGLHHIGGICHKISLKNFRICIKDSAKPDKDNCFFKKQTKHPTVSLI